MKVAIKIGGLTFANETLPKVVWKNVDGRAEKVSLETIDDLRAYIAEKWNKPESAIELARVDESDFRPNLEGE